MAQDVDAPPGGVHAPAHSHRSLHRLKALDSLPDINAQLVEAEELCTHPARADMLARWLLTKLAAAEDARLSAKSWTVLLSAMRMISPERIATLLKPHDIVDIIRTTVGDIDEHEELEMFFELHHVVDFLAFLIEVSDGSDGAAVKAVLTTPAATAARFLGTWVRSFRDFIGMYLSDDATPPSDEWFSQMLGPALSIWALRRQVIAENDLFAEHCLMPFARALALEVFREDPPPNKRPRGRSTDRKDCKRCMERLVAVHIFSPARQAFFTASGQSAGDAPGEHEFLHPSDRINSLIAPLRGLATNGEVIFERILPLLLELALRCSPLSTPRQRTKEMPWIDAVFRALSACNMDSQGDLIDEDELADMFAIISSHASLGDQTLLDFVGRHCKLDRSREQSIPWQLLGRCVEMAPHVFADTELAASIFANITTDVLALRKRPTGPGFVGLDGIVPSYNLVRDKLQKMWRSIVLDIAVAFGKRRDFPTFVELWRQQLQADQHNDYWSVWTSLESYELEQAIGSLNVEQFATLMNSIFNRMEHATRMQQVGQTTDTQSALNADIVVANALLSEDGMFGEKRSALSPLLGQLLKKLTELVATPEVATNGPHLSVTEEKHCWAFMRRITELWCPLYLREPHTDKSHVDDVVAILDSEAVRAAVALMKADNTTEDNSPPLYWVRRDAGCFIATLCSGLWSLSASAGEASAELLRRLFEACRADDVYIFMLCPDLLFRIDSKARRAFLATCFDALKRGPDAGWYTGPRRAVRAMVDPDLHCWEELSETLIDLALERLPQTLAQEDEEPGRLFWPVLQLLEMMPSGRLKVCQRRAVLDAMCQLKLRVGYDEKLKLQDELLDHQLAITFSFLEGGATPTCLLATDPAEIWRFGGFVMATNISSAADEDSPYSRGRTLSTLCSITKALLGQLLAPQDQARNQGLLISFSQRLTQQMLDLATLPRIDGSAWQLAIMEVMVHQFEVLSKDALKAELAHGKALHVLLRYLGEQVVVEGLAKDVKEASALVHTDWLKPAMMCLLSMPDYIPEADPLSFMDDRREAMFQNALLACQTSAPDSGSERKLAVARRRHEELWGSILVLCLELGFKHGSFVNGVDFAKHAVTLVNLPQFHLGPTETASLEKAFPSFISKLDSNGQVMVLEHTIQRAAAGGRPELQLARIQLSIIDGLPARDLTLRIRMAFSSLLTMFAEPRRPFKARAAGQCIDTALKHLDLLTNQHMVESTVAAILTAMHNEEFSAVVFREACNMMSTLFLHYRTRLRGRYHLVVELFQEMISKLFRPPPRDVEYYDDEPEENTGLGVRPGEDLRITSGRRIARLLSLFCDPPQTHRQPSEVTLVDEGRQEQANVGQFAQCILHKYCMLVLEMPPVPGLKDVLQPGLWSIIEAMEIGNPESVKSLSAAMNNSERAILRGVYDEWKRFGKWRGA